MAYNNDNKGNGYAGEIVYGKGNLTHDPKQISGQNAKTTAVVLKVASNSLSYDRDGNEIKDATFREIKLFGATAEAALRTFKKGSPITYSGPIYPTAFTTKDGEEVKGTMIIPRPGDNVGAGLDFGGVKSDGETSRSRSRSRNNDEEPTRSSRSRRSRNEEPEEDFEDAVGDDMEDFEDAPAPSRSRSSRSGSSRGGSSRRRSRNVDVDGDVDSYTDGLV